MWNEFLGALLERFQATITKNPYELLMSLKLTGTVEEYHGTISLFSSPWGQGDSFGGSIVRPLISKY